MVVAVASIFVLALLAPVVQRVARGATGWLLAVLPASIALYLGAQSRALVPGTRLREALAWSPELGVNLSFALDGLSLLFVLLICGVGALVLIYAGGYLAGDAFLGRFYCFLLLFMGAMLGLVLADNVLALFIFWELTSISSYLLIGFTHLREESRAAARQALLITGSGGLVLLVGLILLGQTGGSFELSDLLARGAEVRASPLYLPILALVLVGAFTKSAQFPFHFWLPSAMEAPTPVSAYLHSATMVKAGIYLLARLSPVLGGTQAWMITVSAFGGTTMLVGGVLALYQTDLKRVLAYSTVSALGTLVLMLGIGGEHAVLAAVVFLLAHALYKGALFMVAGAIDHETGTRNLERLGGLRRAMPITTAIGGLAAISLAGFGPVLSFIGKELLLETALDAERFGLALTLGVVLAGALFTLVALLVGVRPFFGAEQPTPKHAHEAPLSMWIGPALLALAGLLFGLVPTLVEQPVIAGAVGAILGHPADVHLYLWHGFNTALGLSVLSLLAGMGLYAGWAALRRTTGWVERALGFWPSDVYRLVLDAINRLSRRTTQLLQSGYLRYYLSIILATTVLLVGWMLVARNGFPRTLVWTELRFYEVGLVVLMLAAALYAMLAPGRLSTVAALGVVGYGVALIYILYGAPDLAMTQILVETLTVLLFVLVFYHLPRYQRFSKPSARLRDAAIALCVGGLMTALVLAATATPPHSRLATFFAENSKAVAHGSNIVNVILVDFRGLDTFGEVTVLSTAAFGVYALLKLRRNPHQPEHRYTGDRRSGLRRLIASGVKRKGDPS